MWTRQTPRAFTLLALALTSTGCGSLSDPGNEPKGIDALPTGGVAPWTKLDLDGDPGNGTQPYVLEPRRLVEGFREPFLLSDGPGEGVTLYYERRALPGGDASLFRTRAPRPEALLAAGPGARMLAPELPWEAGRVGAPTLIDSPGATPRFLLWYAGGDGAGIGVATSDDGIVWTRDAEPVLVPDRAWEQGRVDSPSVLRVEDELWLWYAGGDGDGIGRARSRDGRVWTKDLAPVLVPEQAWEGLDLVPLERGHVRSPGVARDLARSDAVFRMYYTGFVPIDRNPLADTAVEGASPGSRNESIGFAASRDGVTWTRASLDINPVLAEVLPLTLGALPFPPAILDGLGPIETGLLVVLFGGDGEGHPRIPAFETVIDESEAQVLLLSPSNALMCFVQTESAFVPLAPSLPDTPVTSDLGLLIQSYRTGIGLARIAG